MKDEVCFITFDVEYIDIMIELYITKLHLDSYRYIRFENVHFRKFWNRGGAKEQRFVYFGMFYLLCNLSLFNGLVFWIKHDMEIKYQ